MTLVSYPGHPDPAAREIAPAAVLFDLYDTLAHAPASRYFYHSVPTALTRLRAAGLRLAVVSNAARSSEPVLDILGLRAATDAVVMSYAVGVLKPDPRIYRAALDLLGVAPAAAVYVGDGGDGELGGAQRLGLRTVLVERDLPHTRAARAEASFCCRDLSDVAALLLANA